MLVMESTSMFYWQYMPLMLLYSAAGWALYGMILGGSGLFLKRKTELKIEEQPQATESRPKAS